MIEINNFQRIGTDHNTGVGGKFENIARDFFAKQGVNLERNFSVPVGVGDRKEAAAEFLSWQFDSSSSCRMQMSMDPQGGNMPSAKMTVWNEAMYYFHLAPKQYRKIMFVLKHRRAGISLASYYLRTDGHLVPDGVEIWEFDADTNTGEELL